MEKEEGRRGIQSQPVSRAASPSVSRLYLAKEGRDTHKLQNSNKKDGENLKQIGRGMKTEDSKENQKESLTKTRFKVVKSLSKFLAKENNEVKKPETKCKINKHEVKENLQSLRNITNKKIKLTDSINHKSSSVEKWVENQNQMLEKGNQS